jgi:hypothetical protein
MVGTTAALTLASPVAGSVFDQEVPARIKPIVEQTVAVPDQQAQARITPFLDLMPKIPEQQARARITPALDQTPAIQNQQAWAEIIPTLGAIPKLQDQQAQARITPFLDLMPKIPEQQARARVALDTPLHARASQKQQGVSPNITIHQTLKFNTQEGRQENFTEAAEQSADGIKTAIEEYFRQERRLSYA